MDSTAYLALSRQVALMRDMSVIANNVANSTTPGFRAENVTFETVLSQTQTSSVAYSGTGESTFSRMSGPITQTGNPLDVAIHGDAFLSISGANGPVYTRDGRMRISTQGDLENMNGQQVLDQSGGPIQINPAKGAIQISRDGTISQNGDRVFGNVTTGRTDRDLKRATADARPENGAFRTAAELDQAEFSLRIGAEGMDMADAGRGRRVFQKLVLRAVMNDQRMAAIDDALEDLGLGLGNLVEALEIAEMGGGDARHHGHMRPHHGGQRPDLARVVHADLEDAEVGCLGHARQRQRHAPMIVERGDRRMHAALRLEHMAQHLLGRGLADLPGDGDDLGGAAVTRRTTEPDHRFEHVVDDDHRCIQSSERR